MKKRLRKKMWKQGKIKYATECKEFENGIYYYFPEGFYYLHEGKIYKF